MKFWVEVEGGGVIYSGHPYTIEELLAFLLDKVKPESTHIVKRVRDEE